MSTRRRRRSAPAQSPETLAANGQIGAAILSAFETLEVRAEASGFATRGPKDPLSLLEPGEVIIGERRAGDDWTVVTSHGRKVRIDLTTGRYVLLTGQPFPARPAKAPETETP